MDTLRNCHAFGCGEETHAGETTAGALTVGADGVRSTHHFTSTPVCEEHKGFSTFNTMLFLKYKCHPILILTEVK